MKGGDAGLWVIIDVVIAFCKDRERSPLHQEHEIEEA
jgi:hypothetical protein